MYFRCVQLHFVHASEHLHTMICYEKNKFIIIDFQWFRLNRANIIPKELASCTSDYKKSHYIFKPPFSFATLTNEDRQVARYITAFHHGLNWCDGYISCSVFDEIIKRLCADVEVVYVKGSEKVKYLRNILDKPIRDLVRAENISRGTPSCSFHISNYVVCAASNCERFYWHLMRGEGIDI